ncbi:MAG: DUF177 domain-containing protein [Limnochordales bacterium]|nr:DUF177 domain-containing protein [Limnochordales bacterium]
MGAASRLLVDVSGLSELLPTTAITVRFNPQEVIEPPLQVRWTSPLLVRATVQYGGREFIVSGRVSGEAERLCSRCLSPFIWNIDVPLNAEYRRVQAAVTDAAEGPAPEVVVGPEGEYLMTGDRLDLLPVVEEALVLASPIQAYCRPDCGGLCPVCGQNLNEGACGCRVEEGDPRLSALARWLQQAGDGRPVDSR